MKNKRYIESFKMKYEEFRIGCDAVEELGLWDKESHGEMDVFYANDLTGIIIRLIASDGIITRKEVAYLNETFEFDYTLEDLVNVYENCKDEIGHAFDEAFENGITHLRKINGKLADAYKELLALICQIIIESDGMIAKEEIEEVKHLQEICS